MKKLRWALREVRDFVRWLRSRKSDDAVLVIIGASFDLNEKHLNEMREFLESLADNRGYQLK